MRIYNLTPEQLTQAYRNLGGVVAGGIKHVTDARLLSRASIKAAALPEGTDEAFVFDVIWSNGEAGTLIVYIDPKSLMVMGLT